ncbi:uncharacterized protein SPPG_06405 [Spizellomyces punctatus DAOM BR117]|uniref:chitin deacetylase n=1 Tax=Spizellomyces punctatus (strain DAOM BR117) TaxID=645134 RepID=A0A0L0HC12_SPIPD|nr:uncharacterized protein SPPG_06405 [Spizellomyces punctatus DAOM BR117]KNC98727.1 hypothetical protein SPPG_06405 [Spizellomyces punctatus DAOM BR117]|eukprot:XP_016606767.1 hypothetical protein SPPG_06405 [Spizellomyces punctatus DAOM BR117]
MHSTITALAGILLVASSAAAQQCTPYTSGIDATKYPTPWTTATSNGVLNTPEFQAVYNGIDWTKVPNIPPKNWTADGAAVTTGYSATDPDCWWTATQCTTPKHPNILADIVACPEPGTWGITYDDGPNCTNTAFYDFLKQNNQKASMYYIGSNVLDWPNEAKRGYTDGHHINGHTWSHKPMTSLTNQEIVAELYYTTKIIKEVTGVTVLYWRPPFGDIDDRVRAIASQLKLTATIWNRDTDDWNIAIPASQITTNFQNFINEGKNGTWSKSGVIVLEHEIDSRTMGLAMQYYPEIKNAYKHLMPVASCMNITKPYAEDITYPDFATLAGLAPTNTSTSTTTVASSTAPSPTDPRGTAAAGQHSAASDVAANWVMGLISMSAGLVALVF